MPGSQEPPRYVFPTLLIPQTNDGIEIGSQVGRIISEDQAHPNGNSKPDADPKRGEGCGYRGHKGPNQGGDGCPDQDADHTAAEGQDRRLKQELQPNIRAPRSNSFPNSNLLCAFS